MSVIETSLKQWTINPSWFRRQLLGQEQTTRIEFQPRRVYFDSADYFSKQQDQGLLTDEQFVDGGHKISDWKWRTASPNIILMSTPPDPEFHYLEIKAKSVNRAISSQSKQEELSDYYYKVSLTYDKTHKCPRLWLDGKRFLEDGQQEELTPLLIMDDIISDNKSEMVQVQIHPFIGFPQITLNPQNMLKAFWTIRSQSKEKTDLTPEEILSIMISLNQQMIPTITFQREE